jgi:hypothetical protein
MRPALTNGRIAPPRSYREAYARHQQLLYEITKIQGQIEDPGRVLHYPYTAPNGEVITYAKWQDSAKHALKLFRAEAQQIGEYLSSDLPPTVLLKEAYDLIKILEREVDDFTPEEHKVIEKLDGYFATRRE